MIIKKNRQEIKEALLLPRKNRGELTDREIKLYMECSITQDNSYECKLPKQVHEVLIEHEVIADPVKTHCAEESLEVSRVDWIYRAEFSVEPGADRYIILCEGLDTVVDIYLNGEFLATHRDMFFPFRREINPDIQNINTLLFHFYSPIRCLEEMKQVYGEAPIDPAHYLRKAPHDFEDFLGMKPYFAGVGIFAPVIIEEQRGGTIEEFDIQYVLNRELTKADIELNVEGVLFTDEISYVDYIIRNEEGQVIFKKREEVEVNAYYKNSIKIKELPVKLWWPLGYGFPVLYGFEAKLTTGNNSITCCKKIGFREVKFIAPFDVHINHVPVRLWGANLVPINGVTHCYDKVRMEFLFKRIKDANMNFIRLWGGGEPYPDDVYQLADENGILIWGEFFHKWGMYPQDEVYMDLYRNEAVYMLKSFRHHPALIMWCGGNESYMGAEMDMPSVPYIGDKIFEQYEKLCGEIDPQRYYQKNSPMGGDFTNDPRAGDFHGWNHLWYIPYTDYPVMFSENSRVSPPILKSLKKYIPDPEEFWPEGFRSTLHNFEDCLLPPAWMKLKTGPEPYWCSPIEQFYDADTPEALIYKCQAAHAQMLKRIGERLKRGRPAWDKDGESRCKGQLIWKLNDSWPQIFCGLLDYDLQGGIPYYTIKRVFEQIQVSFAMEDNITIWGVNDSRYNFQGTLEFVLFHPITNKIVHSFVKEVEIESGKSIIICDLDSIPQFKRENILYACLKDTEGKIVARNYDFVEIERNLCFPDAKLTLEKQGDGIIITTDRYARCIELSGTGSCEDVSLFFEDNYFDLMPFEKRHIQIECKEKELTITAKAFYSSTESTVKIK